MPLTPFQRSVAHILAKNRNPDSHIAGGAALNRADTCLRISEDLDIFHDAAEGIAASAQVDMQALLEAGLDVEITQHTAGMVKAVVSKGTDRVRLDWTSDSAFRFFPAQPDADFGYVLHLADLATNKVLALAGRQEIRDYLDILQIDKSYLSLAAVMWAAWQG